ncbi:putative F-box/LRR-repeat protein At3g42770 [Papaver somniferum]|uniref:putative F-box/LRR-repeat protein At3g42770 n=1 Tax=Papaver somniferum TaxID=3469 RepID=UPI000E6FEAA4|nr:putative F-box/LRR-repeat protein At3g42770 [Papaver somniferum]
MIKKHSFVMFVDTVFIFRQDFDIQRFSVHWEDTAYENTVPVHVNRWSLNAVKYNVQEVRLVITECHDSTYEIPHRLLNCKSLRKLEMEVHGNGRCANIVLPRSMNLPQLNVLSLYGLSISNLDLSKRLIASCPVLERLDIVDCDIQTDNQRNLVVDSLSLKEFMYVHRYLPQNDSMVNIIKLCAPNLKELTCRCPLSLDYSLENCSPLYGVSFYMNLKENKYENADAYSKLPSREKKVYAERMMKFLGAVYMVKDMFLSPGFLEVLSQAANLLGCQPTRLCNLQYLTLELWCTRGCLRAIAYLLSISPNINSIFLVLKESSLVDVGDDWEAGLSVRGMLSHLEYVQVEDMEGCDAEFKLLSFLLRNAKVLKEVELFFRPSVGSPDRLIQVQQFQDKLREVPAASSSILMGFKVAAV